MNTPRRKQPGSLHALRKEFLVRFYRWAMEDTLDQFRQGFPRLKNLKSGPALKYLEFLNDLPRDRRSQFVLAKLRKCHYEACHFLREPRSAADVSLLGEFYRGTTVVMAPSRIEAYIGSRVEMELHDLSVSSPGAFEIDKALLRSKLQTKLRAILGESSHPPGCPQALLFNTHIGNWSVTTVVETPRIIQLRYHHTIRGQGRSCLIERTSAFKWMGVKLETYWNFLTNSDLDSTADAVVGMCRAFIEAMPGLLRGLKPLKLTRG
jgi:hypothetical protein